MISPEKIQSLIDRFDLVQAKLAGQLDRDSFVQLSREFAELEPVAAKINEIRALEAEKKDLEHILADREAGKDMQELAADEIETVRERLETGRHELNVLLLPKDAADERSVILEVRAGTGGDEAALFAGDLFRMYQRYADLHRWKVEVLSASESELGGYREIIASISGKGVYSRLKYESGVHRVQRVPETEASGRIHTSAATVAVLPEAEDVDVDIQDKDLRIDVYRSSGAGGQHVNTTDSAVRITHLPTGLVVAVQDERSQHKNKARAMQLLRARLYDMERERLDDERAASRKGQVGSGDRSERIRTYNFPQGRVTDHRINLTLYKLDRIIAGDSLDEVIDALVTETQAAQLAALEQ